MTFLLAASLVWSFSFGLIKKYLTGLDANLVAWLRLLLSLLLFVPFLRLKGLKVGVVFKLFSIGAIQFGFMYGAYIHSFHFLPAHQVALFTIFTPIFVTLIEDFLSRRFRPLFFITAWLAVLGAGVIVYGSVGRGDLLSGFFLVQASNFCFALGQVWYRRIMNAYPELNAVRVFALLYLGGVAVAFVSMLFTAGWEVPVIHRSQWLVIFYLGVVASGLGFFFWNHGATKVNSGLLAAANNLKVPLAVLCSLLFFAEKSDPLRLAIGGSIIALALFFDHEKRKG